MPKTKWDKKYEKGRKYRVEWEKTFPWVTACDDGQKAYCKWCRRSMLAKRDSLIIHGKSKVHDSQQSKQNTVDLIMSLNKVVEEISNRNITAVRFEQTDINGVSRSKIIPARHFKEKAQGGLSFFCGHLGMDVQANVVAGSGFMEEIGFGDSTLFPDYETFKVLPWLDNTARILAEPTLKGEYIAAHPRVLARKQLEKLKELGYSLFSAHEHEFYVVDKDTFEPPNRDINIRSTIRMSPMMKFVKQVMDQLPEVGVDMECIETEYGPGQMEMSYKPAFGIQAADNAHTYKTSIKEIALQHGFIASFMTKPYLDKSGSSCHFNHSLWDAKGEEPLIYDPKSPYGISEVGQHWLAGILAHAPAIDILAAPTVNCRKRIAPFRFCPVNATWGIDNRTALVRVRINGAKGSYFEYRSGAAGCNPYVILAATVAAGIDGIINKYELPPELTGNAYVDDDLPPRTAQIPVKMEDALEALINDEAIREALGDEFIKCFTAIKMHEAKLEIDAVASGNKNWDFEFFFEYL